MFKHVGCNTVKRKHEWHVIKPQRQFDWIGGGQVDDRKI